MTKSDIFLVLIVAVFIVIVAVIWQSCEVSMHRYRCIEKAAQPAECKP